MLQCVHSTINSVNVRKRSLRTFRQNVVKVYLHLSLKKLKYICLSHRRFQANNNPVSTLLYKSSAVFQLLVANENQHHEHHFILAYLIL